MDSSEDRSATRSGPSWSQRLLLGLVLAAVVLAPQAGEAKPPQERTSSMPVEESEITGGDTAPVAAKVLQDTIWIADWNFDAPNGSCTSDGWVVYDNRILNDGSNYWQVTTDYAGAGSGTITGAAAALRRRDICNVSCDAYGGNWDYSIVLEYSGPTATLAFKYVSNSEPGFDFVTVESDSLGLSESLVDYTVDPSATPAEFRDVLLTDDGDNTSGVTVAPLALPNYGAGVHEVYIRFTSDGAIAADYCIPPGINAALVVDDIVVTGGMAYSENFGCGSIGCLNPNVQVLNTAPATPFGSWARLYKHITDNDKCTENTTCAWLWTDPTHIAFFPDMAFGPGAAIIRNWLDNIIVSPWTSLASTPSAQGTVLSFRRFPGNRFTQGSIVMGWRVRGKTRIANTDTSALGDSIDCVTAWGHASQFNSLSTFVWVTSIFDATAFFAANSQDVQFSFRVSDWRYLTGAQTTQFPPGPGPYLDRVRIGRRTITGPVFDIGLDTRFQGMDNFPSSVNAITPGEHHSPTIDRFGTCDFRQGTDTGINLASTQIVSGDSITTNVLDARLAGGITSVKWHGAITRGPHAGKAPAPYSVGANGFFEVTATPALNAQGIPVANRWFVDLDDSYLRGGDELLYFWHATDAGGGASSAPAGIGTALPASVVAAEAATLGLFAVTALPEIDWAPDYLARIAADAHGDLEPTPAELAASTQSHCILYYQHTNSNRRSGFVNRTSFMVTLDDLGYDFDYDVFDVQGYGNTNNQLASRASLDQCTGYQLIIEDDGRSNLIPNIPDGGNIDNDKVRQATFYRNWLDAGLTSEAGRATLWVLGESTVAEFPTNALFTNYCGVGAVVQDQALSVNPDVVGQTSFTFTPANCIGSFASEVFSLNGGCPAIRNYDGYTAAGTAIATHRYRVGSTLGPAAVLMNARPATNANTIVMGFAWSDIRSPFCLPPGCPSPSVPSRTLAIKVLACAVTSNCTGAEPPVGVPGDDMLNVPVVSALHQNVPNPFNPTTTIAFDLSRAGHVRLEVFDVGGRSVRTLVDAAMPAGRNHRVVWDGLDAAGTRASSGVYLYRLVTDDLTTTRKMIVLK